MVEPEPIVNDVVHRHDLIQAFGPDSRSGLSNPVCVKMSNANLVDRYFHQDGEPDIATSELVG